jgi:hypothetical protein
MSVRQLLHGALSKSAEPVAFISLSSAARLFPGERAGRSISPSTVYRWATRGLPLPDGRVVKLAIWRVGRKWVTTEESLADFIDAQQPNADGPLPPPRDAPAQRHEGEVARTLEEAGI